MSKLLMRNDLQLEALPKVCRRGEKEATLKLIELLADGTEYVRTSAANALVCILVGMLSLSS